jgi:hypothetical protein
MRWPLYIIGDVSDQQYGLVVQFAGCRAEYASLSISRLFFHLACRPICSVASGLNNETRDVEVEVVDQPGGLDHPRIRRPVGAAALLVRCSVSAPAHADEQDPAAWLAARRRLGAGA